MLLRFARKEDSNGWIKKKDSSDASEDVMKDDFNNLVDNLKNDFGDTSSKFFTLIILGTIFKTILM